MIPKFPIFTLPVELSASLTSKTEGKIDLFFKNISFGLPDIMRKLIFTLTQKVAHKGTNYSLIVREENFCNRTPNSYNLFFK